MSLSVLKYDPSIIDDKSKKYLPVLVVINRKIYKISSWQDFYKMLLFSYCYRANNLAQVMVDSDRPRPGINRVLITSKAEDSANNAKFSPDYYFKVLNTDYNNATILPLLKRYIGKKDLVLFIAKYDSDDDLVGLDAVVDESLQDYLNSNKRKKGSTKHFLSRINGKILNPKEKFYKKVEKGFDEKVLIGDIEISEEEEEYLAEFMRDTFERLFKGNSLIFHDKVFAYGLVRTALKHYSAKTFWPYLEKEYGVKIPPNHQTTINSKFRDIMKRYGKLYYDESSNFVQNYCMHAFVCNKCADQFFDYMFDFWRIDLSRSIENISDEEGNNLFDILIEEIGNNDLKSVQDVMIHTTMALKMNPKGCKGRFRRILKMIDNSYWNDADYSGSSNRITVLFNEWKNKSNSSYSKDFKKTSDGRKHGRGEKLLSRPTITYVRNSNEIGLFLPRQILRHCTEEEHPIWYIDTDDVRYEFEPTLLVGRSSLFTEEATILLDDENLFSELDITLKSEKSSYYRRVIKASDVRFFNANDRCIDIADNYISRDVCEAFVKHGEVLTYLDGSFSSIDDQGEIYDIYQFEPEESDVLILPNNHAISVGKILDEGIVGGDLVKGVTASIDDDTYRVYSGKGRLYFKANKNKLNGTSIKIFRDGEQLLFSRVVDKNYFEVKIDEKLPDICGYFIDLEEYINEDGIYRIELSVPGSYNRDYHICYIRQFEYSFEGAPYIFEESGTISFPGHLTVKTNDDWEVSSKNKVLSFSFNESNKDEPNEYVKDRKLYLDYVIKTRVINMCFDLPVLYWKYKAEDEWLYESPTDTDIQSLPNNIYVSGDLNLRNAKMYIFEGYDLEESEADTNYDKNNEVYYFRTVDIRGSLNREQTYRQLCISVDGKEALFCTIICKSIVKSKSLTGDFKKNLIYGYFDIFGSSDYSVTVKRGEEIIDEDVPVVKGKFEVECEVEEGTYTIILYELEDDNSGFGYIAFELDTYELVLKDVRKLGGGTVSIISIGDRQNRYANLKIRDGYCIKDIALLDYDNDIKDAYELYSWLYDSTDDEQMSGFTYYKGTFGCYSLTGNFVKMSDAIVIFDNNQNMNEVLVNVLDDDYCNPLLFNSENGMLITSDRKLGKAERRRVVKVIDDDIFRISVDISKGGTRTPRLDTQKIYTLKNYGLKQYIVRSLEENGIYTIGELRKLSYTDLTKLQNINTVDANWIQMALHSLLSGK